MPSPSAIVLNGQIGLASSRQMLAAAGKYWNVTNPTPGTAIAYANKTAFSATANGLFAIANTNPSGGANIQLDSLTLFQTATAPDSTLAARFEVYTENAAVALSGAAAARTPVNVNPAFANAGTGASVTSFAAGAGTVPAAGATRRLIDIINVNIGVSVIHDTWVLDFGADGPTPGTAGLAAARATDSARITAMAAPVTIAPGCSAIINAWTLSGATNAPSYEFSLKYIEL